jgi:exonuclease VII large subunit
MTNICMVFPFPFVYNLAMSFVHNQPEYSVSEIAGHVKRVVEDTFGFVRVRGEISIAKVNAASGHCYLTLKDRKQGWR